MDRNGVDKAVLICARIDYNPDNNAYVAEMATDVPGPDHPVPPTSTASGRPSTTRPAPRTGLRVAIDRWSIAGFTHYVGEDNDGWLRSDEGRAFFDLAAERDLIASLAIGSAWFEDLGEPRGRTIRRCRSSSITRAWCGPSTVPVGRPARPRSGWPSTPTSWSRRPASTTARATRRTTRTSTRSRSSSGSTGRSGPAGCAGLRLPGQPWVACTYAQTLEVIRRHCPFIDDADRAWILGDTLATILETRRPGGGVGARRSTGDGSGAADAAELRGLRAGARPGRADGARMARLAELGYEGIELHATEPLGFAVDDLAAAADRAGLPVVSLMTGWAYANEGVCLSARILTFGTARSPGWSPTSSSRRDSDALIVVGLLQGLRSDEPDPAVADVRIVDALRRVARVAEERRVTIVIEPVNHLQVGFNHTAAEVVGLIDRVDSPAVSLMLDTIHMNIEERSVVGTIRDHADRLRHVHLAETNGGLFGDGAPRLPGRPGRAGRRRLRPARVGQDLPHAISGRSPPDPRSSSSGRSRPPAEVRPQPAAPASTRPRHTRCGVIGSVR